MAAPLRVGDAGPRDSAAGRASLKMVAGPARADRPRPDRGDRPAMPTSEPSFDGLRVVAFEARMAGPIAGLIARHGGRPVEAPSLKEVPIEDNPAAVEFADRLVRGEFDAVIFLTGVGSRY